MVRQWVKNNNRGMPSRQTWCEWCGECVVQLPTRNDGVALLEDLNGEHHEHTYREMVFRWRTLGVRAFTPQKP